MVDNNLTKSTTDALTVKTPFIPKRRTPYLMQEEAIKHKEAAEALQHEDKHTDGLVTVDEPSLNKGSQLGVNKESISSRMVKVGNKKEFSPITELVVNKESVVEIGNLEINYHQEVGRLYGIQKKLAHFFVQSCIQRNQNKTGPVTAETLCNITGSTKKTIKKIIQRMLEKKIIARTEGKRGKGGFATYLLDSDFINVVRLQLDLELDHIAINTKFAPGNHVPLALNRSLPESWERIDLTNLTEAFKIVKTKSTQFFGKAQLKAIYTADTKLSADDIQQSVLAFTYGLKNYHTEEPYVSMLNPAAILFETLKSGDKWEERRFLSTEEDTIYKIYINLMKKFDGEIKTHYKKWLEKDRSVKFEYYSKKMGSTQFYNDRVFEEKAWEDYEVNIWPKEREEKILDMIGISNKSIIDKIKLIVVS